MDDIHSVGPALLSSGDMISFPCGVACHSCYLSAILDLRTRDASAWMLAKFFVRGDVSDSGMLQPGHSDHNSCWFSCCWNFEIAAAMITDTTHMRYRSKISQSTASLKTSSVTCI